MRVVWANLNFLSFFKYRLFLNSFLTTNCFTLMKNRNIELSCFDTEFAIYIINCIKYLYFIKKIH